MPYVSPFSTRKPMDAPSARSNSEIKSMDWRGLDLSSPYDVMKPNRSPFARNFRMYAEEADSRRVSISNRKGSSFYSVPLGEAQSVINDTLTGAADQDVGVTTDWKAAPFVPASDGRLTKIQLRLKQYNSSRGPLVVTIHEDNSGVPGEQIAESGIPNSDISTSPAWVDVRFIDTPEVFTGATYWIVLHVQEDGAGVYSWRSHTASTNALTSNTSGNTWSATAYSLNWKVFVSTNVTMKGMARYAPSNGANKTIFASGTSVYSVNDATGVTTAIATGLSSSAEEYHFTFADDKIFWVNGYDGLKTWNGTTVSTITHAQLPTLRLAVFHKNVLWGVPASDPNKIVFSVPPVEDDGSGNVWYNGWLSTNFGYVPHPKASDPITAIIPFQDTLVVFTATTKWQIHGSNAADLSPREATGKKGAIHQRAVFADENFVYFIANDGIYRWNGAEDQLISELIQPEVDRMSKSITPFVTKWKRGVRFYYATSGSAYNNRCLIWNTTFEEWMLDTDVNVKYANPWNDADDNGEMVEASSMIAGAYYAETQDSNLGKAIDFVYHCRPESLNNPAKRKRLVRYIPLLEGEAGDYTVDIGVAKDLRDDVVYDQIPLESEAATYGSFQWGDGTKFGANAQFQPKRLRVSGYAYYWQTRIKKRAINNPVNFLGYVLSYREKRL